MKFLADEGFPKPLATKIKKLGHSVRSIQEKNLQGSSDDTVVSLALKEKRTVLTFDKDFLKNKSKNLQVVLFHFPKTPTKEITPLIDNFLLSLKATKLSKGKIFKSSKSGLEEVKSKI